MNSKESAVGSVEPAFRLESVSPVENPVGGDSLWFRYVISQGGNAENTIVGAKSGSLQDVHSELGEMIARLNERFGKLQSKRK